MLKFDNTYVVTVRSGETGDVLFEQDGQNTISDDFLCPYGKIFVSGNISNGTPYCFLLPDGTAWTGFSWDRTNPWAPYCTSASNIVDTGAQVTYAATVSNPTQGGETVLPPYVAGNVNKWKLFYQWSLLPINLQLKAFGLTFWQSNVTPFFFGAAGNQQQTTYVPQTLVVLPASILVRGRNVSVPNPVAAQTPDILQISYFLSVVGA